ncbi:MAG: hypothetical protein J6T84_04130 [Spirochaetaceae bacterium]|nr:hypothetical protein [Spirochaetaceae bacterium]
MKKRIFACLAAALILAAYTKQAKAVPAAERQNFAINVKAEKKSAKSSTDKNKIDIDFTKYNYNMASAMIFEMFMDQEAYLGKRIKIRGKFYTDKDEHGQFFAVLLYDATACCQTGFSFEDSSRHYPKDYPELLEDIEIVGVFSKKFYGDSEFTYIDCNK